MTVLEAAERMINQDAALVPLSDGNWPRLVNQKIAGYSTICWTSI